MSRPKEAIDIPDALQIMLGPTLPADVSTQLKVLDMLVSRPQS